MDGQSSQTQSNIKPWGVDDLEICYNLEKTASTKTNSEAPVWKLYVPKLMPLITKGLPKETVVTLSDSMFKNDKACKPVVQKRVKQRNYVEAHRGDNLSFAHEFKIHDTQYEVEITHENMENLRMTNEIDSTVP